MWAYIVLHELPYDDPARLERRVLVDYPIAVDRALFGRAPTPVLQRALRPRGRTHGARPRARLRALGLVRPAARRGGLDPVAPPRALPAVGGADVRGVRPRARRVLPGADRASVVGRGAGPHPGNAQDHGGRGPAGLGPLLVAAVRFSGRKSARGHALAAFRHLTDGGPRARRGEPGGRAPSGWAYAGTLGFALVYLGEHYVVDLVAGAALAEGIRAGGPRATPALAAVRAHGPGARAQGRA